MTNVPDFQNIYYKTLIWSIKKHGDQKYDDLPYIFHTTNVCNVLTRFGFCMEKYIFLHQAALLHDVVEDLKATVKEVHAEFGVEVSSVVSLVTDDNKGLTREERHKKTYPILATNEFAVIVKLCDRIANVEYGISVNNLSQYRKYMREYKYFRETLLNTQHKLTEKLWNHLDSLLLN